MDTSSLPTLVQAVEQADSASKLVLAVRRLAQSQEPDAMATLVNVLKYNNPGAAVAAVEGLIALGPQVVPYLLAHIDGYNYGARAWMTRVFAGIGDPRALDILLEAAQSDLALSVRRAAAKGLGSLRWQEVKPAELPEVQQQVFTTLQKVAQDCEWVVRYGAIAGLESLARSQEDLRALVIDFYQSRVAQETEPIVQCRIEWALVRLKNLG